MIFTECPYCNHPFVIALAEDHIGEFTKHDCEECGETFFVEHRRIDGKTYPAEEFIVDEETHTMDRRMLGMDGKRT